MRWWWKKFLATYRLSLNAVCEMSAGMGDKDYHDYDDADAYSENPIHFTLMKCRRCGKEFSL